MTLPTKNKFDPAQPISEKDGRATQRFRDYMVSADALLTAIAVGNGPILFNAANDAAAAAGGVTIGGFYRNGSIIMQRQI